MKVSTRVLATVFATVIGFAAPLWAQNAEFAPVAPTTGTFVFNFTVTLKSTLPKNSVLVCNATATVSEAGPNINQKATGIGSVSGTTGTCKITMPYSWALATAATDKVLLNYSVEVDYALQVTATNGTTTTAQLVQVDKVSENLGQISVPLNGATTTEAVSATI